MVSILDIDSLQIDIGAKASQANQTIDALITRIDRLSASLGNLNGSKLTSLSSGVHNLSTAMQQMNTVKTSDFTRLSKNLTNLNSLDTSKLVTLSQSIKSISTSLSMFSGSNSGIAQITEFSKALRGLGYKSSERAIKTIPQLSVAMRQLINEMSRLPNVSQNLIDFTNALANLARTGGSAGTASRNIMKSFNGFGNSLGSVTKKTFSFASAIGKIYATFWILMRAFELLKKSIDISSDLTEVQNVLDQTFGKYANVVENMSKTSIRDFGMSELTVKKVASQFQAMGTAMGFTQGEMSAMSVRLTQLTADMASFYNLSHEEVAEDLRSIFTGQARPLMLVA